MVGRRNWKTLLLEAETIMAESGSQAHSRIVLLNKVFDDDEFRSENGSADDFKAAEILDGYVQDLAVGFLQLREMLRLCPDDPAWAAGKLKTLHLKTLDILRKQSEESGEERPKRARRGVTVDEYKKLDEEKQDAVARCRYQESQVSDLAAKITVLENENQRLREENSRLMGRIEELERVVSKQFEPAIA